VYKTSFTAFIQFSLRNSILFEYTKNKYMIINFIHNWGFRSLSNAHLSDCTTEWPTTVSLYLPKVVNIKTIFRLMQYYCLTSTSYKIELRTVHEVTQNKPIPMFDSRNSKSKAAVFSIVSNRLNSVINQYKLGTLSLRHFTFHRRRYFPCHSNWTSFRCSYRFFRNGTRI
jgi:hypothetical protein